MADNRPLEDELNKMILEGKILEAFDKFYADDIEMQDNYDDPRIGREAARKYEEGFLGMVAEFRGAELHASAVDGDRSYSEWTFRVTFKDGSKADNTQVSARVWKDGKVVKERFFYKPNMS